jgi:hypothetical protein
VLAFLYHTTYTLLCVLFSIYILTDFILQVLFKEDGTVITCTCGRHEQYGLLCRHIFHVLRSSKIKVFPTNYVMKRWTRDAVPRSYCNDISNKEVPDENLDAVRSMRRQIISATEHIVDKLGHDMDKLSIYIEKINQHVAEVDQQSSPSQPVPKKDGIKKLFGFGQPSEVKFPNPVGIRTKGCGSKKRFMSTHEKVTSKPPRKQRLCTICGSTAHDRRTCHVLKNDQAD